MASRIKGQENQSRSKDRYLGRCQGSKSLQTKQMTAGEQSSHWSYTFSRPFNGTTTVSRVKCKRLFMARISHDIALKMGQMFIKPVKGAVSKGFNWRRRGPRGTLSR